MKNRLGWLADSRDHRDLKFAPSRTLLSYFKLPSKIDLRDKFDFIYDQSNLGSCVANATGACYKFLNPTFDPSRLFIYYNARSLEETVSTDSGCQIRDAIKSLARQGVCKEELDPYNTVQFAITPPFTAFTNAKLHRIIRYERIERDLTQLKLCLIGGNPFSFGISVYESFNGRWSNVKKSMVIAPVPRRTENLLGGHALRCVGFDDTIKCFIVANSWGTDWGDKGYFYLPYDYILNSGLSSDFWVIKG